MHFYEGLHDVWLFFLVTFDPFWTVFGPFWSQRGVKSPKTGQNRSKSVIFGVILDHFLGRPDVILVSLRDHFGIVLTSFGARIDVILTSFEAFLGLFGCFWSILGLFCPFFGHFYGHFAVVWCCFGKLTAQVSKMMQEKAKICKILLNFTKNMQNCGVKKAPFWL